MLFLRKIEFLSDDMRAKAKAKAGVRHILRDKIQAL
jgi:hypothetical protein